MWQSRTKNDLIIEVWEKLDCENVGATEIEAIEIVIADRFGSAAVDSPMVIARLLAGEGAHLRHSEIMELYVRRASERSFDPGFSGILEFDSLESALDSIRKLEKLRTKYSAEGDRAALRLVRDTAISGKQREMDRALRRGVTEADRNSALEIVEWFTIWLQTPAMFETWLELRRASPDFKNRFPAAD